ARADPTRGPRRRSNRSYVVTRSASSSTIRIASTSNSLRRLRERSKQVGFRDDSDQREDVDDRKRTYLVLEHQLRRGPRVAAQIDGDDTLRHRGRDGHTCEQVIYLPHRQ